MKPKALKLGPLAALIALVNCTGGQSRPPGPGSVAGSASGTGGSGALGDSGAGQVLASGGVASGLGGSTGAGGLDAGPGSDAGGQQPQDEADDDEPALPPGPCGDGQLNLGEQCDGAELGNLSCRLFGFDAGDVACAADCTPNTSGCTGTEHCADGYDNDGDGDADCGDTDCNGFCTEACSEPILLETPAHVQGDTTGKPNSHSVGCLPSSGPEVVYAVQTTQPGVLEARLGSARAVAVELRSNCDESTGARCVLAASSPLPTPAENTSGRGAKASVGANETWFVVVDSVEASSGGRYELQVTARPLECGDGHHDPGEACDDGNTANADGCSAACLVETDETEPNDNPESASPMAALSEPFFAAIDDRDDRDVVAVELSPGAGVQWLSVRANTFDLGGGACTQGVADTELQLIDTAGEVLAFDQDSGEGRCSQLELPALRGGTYYLVVSRQPGLSDDSFPYQLQLNVGQCGDGTQTELEQCDDGNAMGGDGCSERCELE